MANAPGLKVYNPSGEYVATCKYGEDAACLAAMYGDGATIRDGHNSKNCVWKEGAEEFPAGESYDRVAELIQERIKARIATANARYAARYS